MKKIKQARLRLNESGSKSKDDPQTPPKESDKVAKHDDNDEDFLDVANDVNFEEDDEDTLVKNTYKDDDTSKTLKEEKDGTSADKAKASMTSNRDKDETRESSEKSPSKESNSIELKCVHCLTRLSSMQVS